MSKLPVSLNEERKALYRKQGFWGDATLLDHWNLSVASFPDKTAVVDYQNARYTFKQLDAAAAKLAGHLKEVGVEAGDVISVQVPNWSEFTLIYIAALKVGAVVNPLMPGFRQAELMHRLGKCQSKVLFTTGDFRGYDHVPLAHELMGALPGLKHVIIVDKEVRHETTDFPHLADIISTHAPLTEDVKVSADDVAIILFTSGTESLAKGVMLTHNNMCANIKGYIAMTQLNCTDIMLMPVPVGHATGFMYGITSPFTMGMTSVLLEKFDAEKSLELIERERCSAIQGPTVIAYDIIRKVNEGTRWDISSLRYFYCGGAPIPKTLVEQAMKLGIHIQGIYGSTESAPHCIVAPFHPLEKVLTTDGTPVPGTEIKLLDSAGNPVAPWEEGEEYSRGPGVFVGYVGEPEMTRAALDEEGWYRSGDLAIMDADGYIRITGRKKDIIIRGGENISSVEIEGILMQHPSVDVAVLVGYPDDRLGERACAYVILKETAKDFTMEEMQAHMAQKGVAKYKWPERIEIVDSIPRTESGKPQKFKLREDIKYKLGLTKQYALH